METTNKKIETGIVNYLKKGGSFKDVAIIDKLTSNEAPNLLPCIVVHCERVVKDTELPLSMGAKNANITAVLNCDSEEITEKEYQKHAQKLAELLEDLDGIQAYFNKPSKGRDTRKTRGIEVHYIEEYQTDSEADGTVWRFGVGLTLVMQGS